MYEEGKDLIEKDYAYVTDEIKQIKEACGDKTLKVIIETCLLTDEEKVKACECILEAKADFVKILCSYQRFLLTDRHFLHHIHYASPPQFPHPPWCVAPSWTFRKALPSSV